MKILGLVLPPSNPFPIAMCFLTPSDSRMSKMFTETKCICNGSAPLLADIVLFGFSLSGFPLKFLKRVC